MTRVHAALDAVDRFARIHFVGFTSVWALLGAAGSGTGPSPLQLLGLVGVSLCFHLYGSVMNDVIDLELDRSQPLRAGDPLVSGAVSRGAAFAFALCQIPLAFAVTLWLGEPAAYGWLALAVLAMAVYNGFGKRCALPPATDFVQGSCWAALVVYGALATGAAPGLGTLGVALYAVLYTTLINGVHGGLRDLDNDRANGARTTALWLGMRPGGAVPRGAWIYCGVLQAALVIVSLAIFFACSRQMTPGPRALALAALIGANALSVHFMVRTLQPALPGWEQAFRLHLGLLLIPLLIAVLVRVDVGSALAVMVVFFTPLLLLDTTQRVLRGTIAASPSSRPVGAARQEERVRRAGSRPRRRAS